MQKPDDMNEELWGRAQALVDATAPEDGWTHDGYWSRVQTAACALLAERQDCADTALAFHGGNEVAKAIMYDGNWDAYGWEPAKPPEPSGLQNAYDPKTGLTNKRPA